MSGDTLQQIRQRIVKLTTDRGPEKSVCPSEVARQLFPADWRNHMDEVRRVAAELADEHEILVTQGTQVVDPRRARGPIRLRAKPS